MSGRRLLIITTTFFPDPSVGGVRMTNWCRVLPDLGWRPLVLSRFYGHEASAERLAAEVHPVVRVEYVDRPAGAGSAIAGANGGGVPLMHPERARNGPEGQGGLRQWMKRIAERLGLEQYPVPDPSVFAWMRAVPTIARAALEYRPEVIVTTGPPHAVHLVGPRVRAALARAGVRAAWVADFRDPYTMDSRFRPSGAARVLMPAQRWCEEWIYRRADLVLCAIPTHARWVRRRFPSAAGKIRELMNACAPALAEGRVSALQPAQGRKSVRIVGFMGREEVLLTARAVNRLAAEGITTNLRLVGPIPEGIDEARHWLGDRLIEVGPVPHDEAMRHVMGADVLVSFLSERRSREYLLSSKLFEFLATGKPVIEVNPTQPDRHLLRREPAATVLVKPSADELYAAIKGAMERGVEAPAWFGGGTEGGREYRHSWWVRGRQLAAWLEELADTRPAEASVFGGVVVGTTCRQERGRESPPRQASQA